MHQPSDRPPPSQRIVAEAAELAFGQPAARALLDALSVMSPVGVDIGLLIPLVGSGAADPADALAEQLRALIGRGLARRSEGGSRVCVPVPVQRTVRDVAAANGTLAAVIGRVAAALKPSITFSRSAARANVTHMNNLWSQVGALYSVATHAHLPVTRVLAELMCWLEWYRDDCDSPVGSPEVVVLAYDRGASSPGPRELDSLYTRNRPAHDYGIAGAAEAIPLFAATLARAMQDLGPDHPAVLNARDELAHACSVAGQTDNVVPLYEEILAGWRRLVGPEHSIMRSLHGVLAQACEQAGLPDNAISWYEAALADDIRDAGPDDLETLTTHRMLAEACRRSGRMGKAVLAYHSLLTEFTRVFGLDHDETVEAFHYLVAAYRATGQQATADAACQTTYDNYVRALGAEHRLTRLVRDEARTSPA